jgi:hypothetical protein
VPPGTEDAGASAVHNQSEDTADSLALADPAVLSREPAAAVSNSTEHHEGPAFSPDLMRGAAERSNLPQEQGAAAGGVASHPGEGATDSVWQGISEALGAVSGGSVAVGGPASAGGPPVEPAAASTMAEGHPSADAADPPATASADAAPSGAAEAVYERSQHVQPLQCDSGATAATTPAGAQESSEADSASSVPEAAAVAEGGAFSSSELEGSSEHAGDQDAAAAGKVDESASACKQS